MNLKAMRMGTVKKGAFTLIELLVVMAIIGILAGVLLPVFAKAREKAKKTKAGAEVKQLDMAWRSMLNDYRTWERAGIASPAGVIVMGGVQVNWLQGGTGPGGVNPKGMVYMEFPTNAAGVAGAGFLDPWGTPYNVKLDDNYDNQVDAGPYGIIPRPVAVWSSGSLTNDSSDDVRSWE